MTSYDYYQQQLAERAKREANVKSLTDQLNEAKGILRTIQATDINKAPNRYEVEQDIRTVQAEVRRLQAFLDDEQKAYKATFEASPDEVAKLNI